MFVPSRSATNSPEDSDEASGTPARKVGRSGTAAHARELKDAFDALGIEVWVQENNVVADGTAIALPVTERAHPHPGEVSGIVEASGYPGLMIADRLSDSARQILRDWGWSFLDRRGHLRIWVSGLRIDAPIGVGHDARSASTTPWTPVGLEIALHALIHPEEEVSARAIVRDTNRSPGGTQEILNRFIAEGLIGAASRLPLLPDLFWETATHWPDDGWLPLSISLPEAVDVAGSDELIRVDERAATLGGARIAAAGDLPARCYAPKGAMRRLRPYGGTEDAAQTWVRQPPVRWLPDMDEYGPDEEHPWRVAHPILCALRLAADDSRGREIVEDWGIVPR